MDDLERDLARLGEPRPLPESLRQALEAALIARASGAGAGTAGDNPLAGLDAPRPLPAGLDERLSASLAVGAAPLPRRLRRRVEAALAPGGRRRPAAVVLAAAAAVVLLAATVGTLVRAGGPGRPRHQVVATGKGAAGKTTAGAAGAAAEPAAGASAAAGAQGAAGVPAAAGAGAGAGGAVASGAASRSAGGSGAAAGGAFSRPPAGTRTAPPPYAFDPNASGSRVATAGPQLRVGVVGGDPAQEAGFRAYVQLLNQAGGAGGHTFALVPVKPRSR